ncbi:hypothetical protein AAVH_29639 [Aphelenchoides avenae]|nr:hypothetical protein AAVH_29639 [Aphelenchus avenae]
MSGQFIGGCIKMKEKLYGLELNETEFAALAGLWMFATLERHDLLQDELIKQRDTVLDELHRYLMATVESAKVGVRMGRLLLYLQSLTELVNGFSDFVVMGRLFLPEGWTNLWDLWDEHEPQLSQSLRKTVTEA